MESTLGGQRSPSDSKPQARKSNVLDNDENRKLLRQMEEWYEVERIRQAPNRYQMAIDDDFFDGLQFSDEDAQELASRGQAPLVYNKVQPAVKWITGTEKRTKIDYKILPRNDAGVNEAENKTKVMKYIDDVNKAAYARSRAFEDAVKVGQGWLECGIRGDPEMEPIYDRNESWRNIIADSQASEMDYSDGRYEFRHKWVDEDIATLLFPKRKEAIKAASVYSDFADAQDNEEWYLGQILQERAADGSVLNRRTFVDTSSSLFNRRARVKLIECWYRRPETLQYMHAPAEDFHNKQYDPNDDTHKRAVSNGGASLYDRLGMKMWCAIFLRGTLLQNMRSPYKHNDFPFTPVWANRRGRDKAPYGVVRVIRDPQEDFNKRMSKALFSLSTRRVIMDQGAIEDLDEVREEAARPDAVFAKKKGYELKVETDMDVAEAHIKYANLDEKAIQDNSGVTDELLGHKSNAISGKAIEARQDQGSTVTTDLFDNYRLAVQLHGQKKLSLIKQFMTVEQTIRVTGAKAPDDFVTINKQQPDGSMLNDVTQTEADFIVSETDYRATQRQAMYETLLQSVTELTKVDPRLGLMLLDDVMEFSDIPGKEQIVATIRQLNGKPDPNKRLTPQEIQAIEQKQAQQQAQQEEMQQIQVATAAANLEVLKGKAADYNAKAQKALAEAGAGAGDGGAAGSYNDAVQQLHDETAKVIDQYQKEILELERQLNTAELLAQNRERDAAVKVQTVGMQSNTAITVAAMKNSSQERVAAINDRTLEATKGLQANIEGLDKSLQEIARTKVDKPNAAPKMDNDPFGTLHARVDKQDAAIAKASGKPLPAKKPTKATSAPVAQAAPAPAPAPEQPAAAGHAPDMSGVMAQLQALHQKVADQGAEKHLQFENGPDGRIQKIHIRAKRGDGSLGPARVAHVDTAPDGTLRGVHIQPQGG